MHRHGYKGRKFGRERDQREALIQGLATALFEHESIETTLMKAKELVPYAEKLITKAKKGGLHNRRQIVASIDTVTIAHKLVDEIAPKLTARDSGHLRIERTSVRRGDNTQLARVSFVDDLKSAPVAKAAKTSVKAKQSHEVDEKAAATADKPAKVTRTSTKAKTATVVAKRTGVRGNR